MKGEIIIENPQSGKSLSNVLDEITGALLELSINIVIAHWNLRGMDYGVLHERLGLDYKDVIEFMDRVAERSVVLGGNPLLDNVSEEGNINPTLLKDMMTSYENSQRLIDKLISNEELGDEMSRDMLIEIQESLQLKLGFLNQTYRLQSAPEGEMNKS